MTADLVDQLLAALDRAEATARAATPGPWCREHPDWPNTSIGNGHRTVIASAAGHGGSWPTAEDAAHIAANGPDVALRAIAAHRRIVDRHQRGVSHPDECGRCNDSYPCDDLRDLAAIYLPESGHVDA